MFPILFVLIIPFSLVICVNHYIIKTFFNFESSCYAVPSMYNDRN